MKIERRLHYAAIAIVTGLLAFAGGVAFEKSCEAQSVKELKQELQNYEHYASTTEELLDVLWDQYYIDTTFDTINIDRMENYFDARNNINLLVL